MTPPRTSAFLLAGILAAGAVSCGKDAATPPAAGAPAAKTAASPAPAFSGPKPNLVLITMEATRADHLGCYDDPLAATPALDRLAGEGARFTQAVAVTPLTRPSHSSLLTGLYPSRHGVRDDSGPGLEETETTLAEHLKTLGYATAASVGAGLLSSGAGLNQGFDGYAEPERASRSAESVVNDAIAAVDRIKGGPFFLWVQLDDPRAPYAPPLVASRIRFAGRLYDGEIAWVDAQVKRLLDHLRTRGVLDGTAVVATADHGESLGDHGEETHGLFLYDSTLKVPLIVRFPPRIAAGTKFEGLVSGVDLAPTLLELMGLPPMSTVQGESCAARLLGANAPEREIVYAESLLGERAYGWAPLYALRSSTRKFVSAPEPELYDLRRDPAETINLAAKEATAIEETWQPALDEALHAIGAAGDASGSKGERAARRDPKTLVAVSNLVMRAQLAVELGHQELAMPFLQQSLAKDPGNPAAASLLAVLSAQPVAPAEPKATAADRSAPAPDPQGAEAHYARGSALAAQGDAAGAEGELRAAVAADPKMANGWNRLGILLDKTNRRPEALAAFSRALDASPDHADALFNRAKLELLEKQLPEARRDLDRLLEAHADYAAGRLLEAHLCVAENDTAGAKAALSKLLALSDVEPRVKEAAEKLLAQLNGG